MSEGRGAIEQSWRRVARSGDALAKQSQNVQTSSVHFSGAWERSAAAPGSGTQLRPEQ